MKIFFATDIHGSEICWRKFLNSAAFYKADMVVLGGDVTGKVLVPILAMPGYWEVTFGGKRLRLETKAELDEIQRKIRDRRSYPAVMAPDELDALNEADGSVDRRFTQEMTRGLDRWLDMADSKLRGGQIPCVLNGGNDDIWEIDDIIEQSPCVSFGEAKVITSAASTSPRWAGPTRRRGTRSGRPRRTCSPPRSMPWSRRSPTWSGRSSTSTRRPTVPGSTRRCGRLMAAR